ncbi:MAG: F0F1 ATP synthase subunit A [Xanthobacteraceae bacterium]
MECPNVCGRTIASAAIGNSARSFGADCRRIGHDHQVLRRLAVARRDRRRPPRADSDRSPGSAPMIESPLATKTLFMIGPVPFTEPVVTTWGLMAVLTLGGWLATRSLTLTPSRHQAVLELIVGAIEDQVRSTMRIASAAYVPMIGTLFLFILTANWSSLVPGIEPPTAHIETDAALGLIVFFAIIYFGIRARGFGGYLSTFAEPSIVMIPLNVVEAFTRTFSLIVRLFGNVMSGAFIVGIVLSLAGLLVPIPLMALELLVGAIQAYIFTVLAMVFIASAVSEGRTDSNKEGQRS